MNWSACECSLLWTIFILFPVFCWAGLRSGGCRGSWMTERPRRWLYLKTRAGTGGVYASAVEQTAGGGPGVGRRVGGRWRNARRPLTFLETARIFVAEVPVPSMRARFWELQPLAELHFQSTNTSFFFPSFSAVIKLDQTLGSTHSAVITKLNEAGVINYIFFPSLHIKADTFRYAPV